MKHILLTGLAATCLALAPGVQSAQACCSCAVAVYDQNNISWEWTTLTFEDNLNNEITAHEDWLVNEWWEKHFLKALQEYVETGTLLDATDAAVDGRLTTFQGEAEKNIEHAARTANLALAMAPDPKLPEMAHRRDEILQAWLAAEAEANALANFQGAPPSSIIGALEGPNGEPDLGVVFAQDSGECSLVQGQGDSPACKGRLIRSALERPPSIAATVNPQVTGAICQKDSGQWNPDLCLKIMAKEMSGARFGAISARAATGTRVRELEREKVVDGLAPHQIMRRQAASEPALAREGGMIAIDGVREAMEEFKTALEMEALLGEQLALAIDENRGISMPGGGGLLNVMAAPGPTTLATTTTEGRP